MSELYELVKGKFINGAKRRKPPNRHIDFKPTEIPDGFVLLVDTREQMPLFTKEQIEKSEKRIENGLVLIGKTLKNGDYSVGGLENLVSIERKQQSDFESYITSEYKRKTLKKLERLSGYYFKALVIEADENDLYEFPISDYITREVVRSHLCSFRIHYGLHVIVNDNREYLERFILDALVRCYRYLIIDRQKDIEENKESIEW